MAENRELINAFMQEEIVPSMEEQTIDLQLYKKIPFDEVMSLGAVFATLPQASRTLTRTIDNGPQRLVFRLDTHGHTGSLMARRDGSGYTTAIMQRTANGATEIVGNASYVPEIVGGSSTETITMPFNPTTLVIAAALLEINQKLDVIQEAQQEILDFLRQKENAKLKGNVTYLYDVFNKYKHNCDNERYKSGNHSQVLQIEREAEQSIFFSRDLIEKKFSGQANTHWGKDVKKLSDKVREDFKNYQLALYIYSFAAFLEVVLAENFDREYLDSVTNKIREYSFQYRELYTQCYDQLEIFAETSIEAKLAKGAAGISRFAGNTIAKIPVISNSQIDENLVAAGDRLDKLNKERVGQTMDEFRDCLAIGVNTFIQNISTINQICNTPNALLLDGEAMYVLA